MHPGKHDHVGIGCRGVPCKLKAVAREIGEVLNFPFLIIMRKDHGVQFPPQPVDFPDQIQARSGTST